MWLLLGLFSVQQAFFAVNQPTRSAVLPRLLPLNLLPAANSLNMTVMQAGAIGGPLIAGALIPVFGFPWLYLIDTLTLIPTLGAVCALPPLPIEGTTGSLGLRAVIDGLRLPARAPGAADVLPRRHHRDGLRDAAGAVPGDRARRLRRTGRAAAWRSRCCSPASRSAPCSAGCSPAGSPGSSARASPSLAAVIVWGLAMFGFGVAVGLADRWRLPMLVVSVLMLVIGGAADMASAAFRSSMLQSAASDDVRGRLQGVFTVVVVGGPRIADVVHGAVAVSIGAAATAAGGGLLVVVLTVVAAVAFPAFIRYRVVAATRSG